MTARLRRAWLRIRPRLEWRALDEAGDYIETDWGGWAIHSTRAEALDELDQWEDDANYRQPDGDRIRGRVEARIVLAWLPAPRGRR